MPLALKLALAPHVVREVRVAAVDHDVAGRQRWPTVCSSSSTAAAGTMIQTTRGEGSFASSSWRTRPAWRPRRPAPGPRPRVVEDHAAMSGPAKTAHHVRAHASQIRSFRFSREFLSLDGPGRTGRRPQAAAAQRIRAQKASAGNCRESDAGSRRSGDSAGCTLGERDAIAAGGLRLIERAVRALHHGFEMLGYRSARHADRYRDIADALVGVGAADLAALDRAPMRSASSTAPAAEYGTISSANSSPPMRAIGPRSPVQPAQHVGDRDDDLVAEQMAVGVVDGLEVIDVDDQQRAPWRPPWLSRCICWSKPRRFSSPVTGR